MTQVQIDDVRKNPETGVRERWNGQFWERIDAGSINEPSKKNKTTGTKPPVKQDVKPIQPKQQSRETRTEIPRPRPEPPKPGYGKIIAVIIVLAIVGIAAFTFLPSFLSASTAAPLGSAENPYLIKNGEDLKNIICGDDTVHYALANDIDLSGYSNWEPIFVRETFLLWNDFYYFEGVLDGRGHTITGLKCTDDVYPGLFRELRGTVKSLNIKDAKIVADNAYSAGIIAAANSGTISNCQVSGTVTGSASSIGGIVGSNRNIISGSSFTGTVSGKANNMGGVAGGNGGKIIDTSFKGTVTSGGGSEFNFAAGGIAGTVYGTVQDSSASGQISGVGHVGGIAGTIDGGEVINCKSSGSVNADLVMRSGSQKYAMAGGIAGLVKGYSSSTGTVQDCTSSASVSAEKISGFTLYTYTSETGRIAAYIGDYGQVL